MLYSNRNTSTVIKSKSLRCLEVNCIAMTAAQCGCNSCYTKLNIERSNLTINLIIKFAKHVCAK